MTDMLSEHGNGKNQEFFLTHGEEADAIMEEEINGMSNSELIDLMEMAGIIRVKSHD